MASEVIPLLGQNFIALAHERSSMSVSDEESTHRKAAAEHFAKKGLPTRKEEEWKYTSLNEIARLNITASEAPPTLQIETNSSEVKIHTTTAQSPTPERKNSFKLLRDWRKTFQTNQRKIQSPPAGPYRDTIDALHEACVDTISHIQVKDSSKTVYLKLSLKGETNPKEQKNEVPAFPRILIHVDKAVDLVISTDFSSQALSLCNVKIQIIAEEGAKIRWAHIQNQALNTTHFENIEILAREKSEVHLLSVHLGSKLMRQNLRLTVPESKANCKVHGIYLTRGEQHFDFATIIEHLKGENQTAQSYKGILDDSSRAVFNGLVYIEKKAQGAFSQQINKSLLLSEKAEADSKPQLQIYADDVKATHGATVGQLSADEIFYLRSRGISESKAIAVLSQGFLAELIYDFEVPELRGKLLSLLSPVSGGH